jgi:hypothetical protein
VRSFANSSIAVGRGRAGQPAVHPVEVVEPLARLRLDLGRADERRERALHLRALRGTAHDDHRAFEDAGLLLQTARVRDPQRRLGGQPEERPWRHRPHDADALEQTVDAERLDASERAGMQRQHHRKRQGGELAEHDLQGLGVVDVLGAVQGGHGVAVRLEPE